MGRTGMRRGTDVTTSSAGAVQVVLAADTVAGILYAKHGYVDPIGTVYFERHPKSAEALYKAWRGYAENGGRHNAEAAAAADSRDVMLAARYERGLKIGRVVVAFYIVSRHVTTIAENVVDERTVVLLDASAPMIPLLAPPDVQGRRRPGRDNDDSVRLDSREEVACPSTPMPVTSAVGRSTTTPPPTPPVLRLRRPVRAPDPAQAGPSSSRSAAE